MSGVAIRVEHLGKQYRIGARQAAYRTIRESLTDAVRQPFRRLRGERSDPQNTIWALDDVSFEIKHGEAVGIIGRNGAGKSTLLKILSRITSPTRGRVELFGRVGSLLEVGTGFHPELTGRENIYLNGAILGMSRREIERKFDEIVAFSEIEKFLDTPVKYYSSGMYVRLAFAVSAHLEPEILVVDEVLAVGDAAFQKKCLGKMGDVSKEGRTVIFVSHNMAAIATLCERCFLIHEGAMQKDGYVSDVIPFYQSSLYSFGSDTSDLSNAERYGNGKARFTSLAITPINPDNAACPYLVKGGDLNIEFHIAAHTAIREANAAVIIYDAMGYRLIDANTALKNKFINLEPGEKVSVKILFHDLLLKPGLYLVGVWFGRANIEDIDGITYVSSFMVEEDIESVKHMTTFPGSYQCRFSEEIKIL